MGFSDFEKIRNYSLLLIIIVLLVIGIPQVQPINTTTNSLTLNINTLNNTKLDFNFKSGSYSINQLIQEPIEIGTPVSWKLLLSDGLKLYGVDYQTAPVLVSETESLQNTLWKKNIQLTTDYQKEYTDLILKTKIKPLKSISIDPNYSYEKTNTDELEIQIPYLLHEQNIEISGQLNETRTNISFKTSKGQVDILSSNGYIDEFKLEENKLQLSLTKINLQQETKIRINLPFKITSNTSIYTFNELGSEKILLPYDLINNKTIVINPAMVLNSFSKLSNNKLTIYGSLITLIEPKQLVDLTLNKETYFVGDKLVIKTKPENATKFIYLTSPNNETNLIKNNYLFETAGIYQLEVSLHAGELSKTFNKQINVLKKQNKTELETEFGLLKLSSKDSQIKNLSFEKDNLKLILENISESDVLLSIDLPIPLNSFLYLWQKTDSGDYQRIPFKLENNDTRLVLNLSDGKIDADKKQNGQIKLNFKFYIPQEKKREIINENKQVEIQQKIVQEPIKQSSGRTSISSTSLTTPEFVLKTNKGDISTINLVDKNNFPFKPTTRTFQNDLLKFKIINLSLGETISVDIKLNAVLKNPVVWKFNPNKIEWYKYDYEQIDPTTIRIKLTDGGLGDDDGIVNGIIEDDLGITNNWWNTSWDYRQLVVVNNSGTTTNLVDYPIKLELTNSNMNESFNWSSDKDAIRFTYYNETSDSETKLNYYLLSWNTTAKTAIVWINLTNIPGSATDYGGGDGISKVFIYSGNSLANSESDGNSVFTEFINFSERVVETYGGTQDTAPNNISYTDLTLNMWTNNWKKVNISSLSLAGTGDYLIHTDFISRNIDNTSDFNSIGLDNDDSISDTTTYELYQGNQQWGLQDYNNYVPTDWKTYNIVLDDFSGTFDRLIFVNDNDDNDVNNVSFRNVWIRKYITTEPTVTINSKSEFSGLLNVTIDLPTQNSEKYRTSTFTMNGTINCYRGNCENVSIYYQYFATQTPLFTLTESTSADFQNYTSIDNMTYVSDVLKPKLQVSGDAWWNDDWIYRETINISNVGTDLSNYPVKVVLNSTTIGSNFNWSSEEDKLRIIWYNESSLSFEIIPYYVEEWNISNSEATIWPELPYIKGDDNTTIVVYYGNSNSVDSYQNESICGGGIINNTCYLLNDEFDIDDSANYTIYTGNGGDFTWDTANSRVISSAVNYDFFLMVENNFIRIPNDHFKIEINATTQDDDGLSAVFVTNTNEFYAVAAATNYQGIAGDAGEYIERYDGIPNANYQATSEVSFGDLIDSNDAYHKIALEYNGTNIVAYYDGSKQSSTANIGKVEIKGLGLGTHANSPGAIYDYLKISRSATNNLGVSSYSTEQKLNYSLGGEYVSKVLDTGYDQVNYLTINWSETLKPNTSIKVYTRTSEGPEGAWFDKEWSYRKDFNISNTAKDAEEYQVFIKLNLSNEYSASKIKSDCSDVRFTYYNASSGSQSEISFYTDYCNLSKEDETGFWVKIPVLKNNTITKVYMYYGNSVALSKSNIEQTFSYSSEKTVAYVVGNVSSSAGLTAISLEDDNSITITSTNSMNEFDTITSSATIATAINATKLLDVEGSASDGTDMVVPISWASTEFVVGGMRSTDVICMLAPFGNSNVTIYDGGTEEWNGIINNSGNCIENDISSGNALRINSDIPILAFHTSTTLGDGFVLYPPTIETLYGSSVSTSVFVDSVSSVTANCYGSDGTTESLSITPDSDSSVSSITSGNQGTGVAIKIIPTGNINAIRQADSDGYETTVLVPRKEMSTKFGSSLAAEYISVVSYIDNTNCTVKTSSGEIGSALTNNSGTDYGVYKACFGCGSSTQYVNGNWELECTNPVWAYYEKELTDDETNLFGYKQMRQYIYPEPSISSSEEISKSDVLNTTNYFQWSNWFLESNGASISSPSKRYIQYKVILSSDSEVLAPQFNLININYKAITLDWKDMETSGTSFEASSPYNCGSMIEGDYCTPSLSVVPKNLGNYSLRLKAVSSNKNADIITSVVRNVSVFLQPVLSMFTSSSDPVARNTTTTLKIYLYDEAGQAMENYNISFVDETANGTPYSIGSVLTDSSGLATIDYLVLEDSVFGSHTINASYLGDSSNFIKPVSDTLSISVTSQPKISNITVTPQSSGFGNVVNITANLSDDRGLSIYKINITGEDGVMNQYDMNLLQGDIYYYIFNNSWETKKYNFTITITNVDGISSTSESTDFQYNSELQFNFTTDKTNYMNNELVKLGSSNWYYDSNPNRIELNVSNTAGDLEEYQVYVNLDFSEEYGDGNIQQNCSDIRFTYYDNSSEEKPIDYYIDYCDLDQEDEAYFWIKIPSIKNNTITKVFLYYGGSNTTSLSSIEDVFSYSTPRTVAYVVSSTDASDLDIISLEDNNTIYVGSTVYNLNESQTTSTGAVNVYDAINATKLFNIEGSASESDMVVPISWAGTEFYYGGMRGTDEFCMLAPFGDSSVTIYDGATSLWSGTISSTGSCVTADIATADDGRIIATKPILVFHQDTDSWVLYPATTETLYGPTISNYAYVASSSSASSISYKGSSGTFGTTTLSGNSVLDLASYLTAGASGTGEATSVKGSTPIGAMQQADSDGGESTVFVSRKEMSTKFGSAQPVEYVVFVTPTENTNCTLYDNTGSYITSVVVSGSNGVYKGIMGSDEASLASAGWSLKCTNPVWTYYEEKISSNGEETNMFGYKQMRQLVYPEPTITEVKTEYASGLQNLGTEKHDVYLRMQTQRYTGSSWVNIIPPIVDQYAVSIAKNSVLNINKIWNIDGAWNTSTYNPGNYRVFAVIEDDSRNTLINTDDSLILGYSYFTILNATLSVSNLTFENKEEYNLEEYETEDTIDWINVTVFVENNTAFSANISLNILDASKQSVSWGPNGTKYCGDISVNGTCEKQWNNSSMGYEIPSSVSSGTYKFYWNINLNASNAPAVNNNSLNFKIYNMPSYINGYFEQDRINKPNSTIYFVNITNPWSRNLTNISATINCPDIVGLKCYDLNNNQTILLGNLSSGESKIINYTVEANESIPSNNYNINITLNYTNPGNEFHSREEVGNAILEIRNVGILEINVTNYPTNITRGFTGTLNANMNNTGDSIAQNTWFNYTLVSGWSVTSGTQDLFTSSVGIEELVWNNITVSLSLTSDLGPQEVRIDTAADDGRIDFKTFNIDVYANSNLTVSSNVTIVNRGEYVQLNASLTYENGTSISNKNISFKDITTGEVIGTNLTNSNGVAIYNYYINSSASLGVHNINVSSEEDSTIYVRASQNSTTIDVHERPTISDFKITPEKNGYNQSFSITASIFDADDIANAKVWINTSNGTIFEEEMNLNPPSNYYYNFADTWNLGLYQVKLIANDTTGAVSETELKNFTVSSDLMLNVLTEKQTYSQNEQVNLSSSNINNWWNNSWKYRVPINVSNIYDNLTEYQVFISKDFSTQYSNNQIDINCSDVRFTFYNQTSKKETAIDYYTDYCKLDKEDKADFWVKIPSLKNDTTTKLYLYYGNSKASSKSNITKVFTYSTKKTIAYIDSNLAVSSGVGLVSLADSNEITVGSTDYSLDDLESATLSSLSLNTSIKTTNILSAVGSGDTTDMVVPISWAGTTFLDGGMRGTDIFCLLSPFGDASVTIYDAGSSVWSGTINGAGNCVAQDITSGNGLKIISDIPILAFHESSNGRDGFAMYPATTLPIYGGSNSGGNYITAGSSATTANCYGSDGSTDILSISANDEGRCSVTSGAYGTGAAIKVQGNYVIGGISQADSNGGESSVYVPRKEMSTVFGSPFDARYLAIASAYANVNCSLYTSTGYFASNTSVGSSTNNIYKISFNTGASTGTYITGPWKLECTKPVWAYFENIVADSDETNMLGYKQMRQFVYPTPESILGSDENKGSLILNNIATNNSGYLLMKVQKNNSGVWTDVSTIVDDITNGIKRTINLTTFDLSSIWTGEGAWNTGLSSAGVYRIYAELRDADSNILKSDDGVSYVDTSLFEITQPSLLLNISDLRIYDVTDTESSNWHIYTNDLTGEGLNSTYTLYKNHVYRFELDINNIGESSWKINETNISYFNFDSSWPVNSNNVWYSTESLLTDRRSDTNYEGGSYDGTVDWNETMGGQVSVGDTSTFFVVINLTSVKDVQVDFNVISSSLNISDLSTLHLVELDTQPPVLYNNIYNLTNINVTRGNSTTLYARWDETIASANFTYATTTSTTFVTYSNTSPQNSQNWTNYTIDIGSTWYLGNHQSKTVAVDESGNVNNTLNYINFTVFGIAELSNIELNTSTINVGDSIQISCKVIEKVSLDSVNNYEVIFKNGTGEIGRNNTNSSGWASFIYTDHTLENENISCFIEPNTTTYYKTDDNNIIKTLLTTKEIEPPQYHEINYPLVAHRGETINLNVRWTDNYKLSNATLEINNSGTVANESTQFISGTDAWANFTYQVPVSTSLGNISWKQYASDYFNNQNQTPLNDIEVWGYSKVSDSSIDPASMQEGNTTVMKCRLIDANTSVDINNYQVSFYYKNSTEATYNVLGTNTTNTSGWAEYNFIIHDADTYTVLCNISNDASKLYNKSTTNYATKELNVVSGSDTQPPRIVGNNYTINVTEIYIGECFKVSGLWDESINESYIQYNNSPTIIQRNISTPYTNNWTNISVCTNGTWTVGNYSIKLFAKDQEGNLNNTLEYKYLQIKNRVSLHWNKPSGILNRTTNNISCKVVENFTGDPVENYEVKFYDGNLGYLIGTANTNASGIAEITYDYSSINVGNDDLTCTITANDDYDVSGSTSKTETVTFYGYLNATINKPQNGTILHRSTTADLNASVLDEFQNTPKDENGAEASLTSKWFDYQPIQIGTGTITTWNVPSAQTLGEQKMFFNVSQNYYYPSDDSTNVTIFGYANVSLQKLMTGTYDDNVLLNITCLVSDATATGSISNYHVNISQNGSVVQTSTTNSSGQTTYQVNTNTLNEGNYEFMCQIGNETSLFYDKTTPYMSTVNINIDKQAPQISYNPSTDTTGNYSRNWTFINVSASDQNLDKVILNWNGSLEELTLMEGTNYWINKTSLPEGIYSFNVSANDTINHINTTETRTVTIDLTAPIVVVSSPINNSHINTTETDLNYTVTDLTKTSCEFKVNGGIGNMLPDCQNISIAGLSEGTNVISLTVTDIVNHVTTVDTTVIVDTQVPHLTVSSPTNGTTYQTKSVDLNYTVSDETGLDSCWYIIDSSVQQELISCQNTTLSGLTNEWHNITVYVNDTAGNINSSLIQFEINYSELVTTPVYPTNNSVLTSVNISLNASTNKEATECNYTLDESTTASLSSSNNISWGVDVTDLSQGNHNVSFTCTDNKNTSSTGLINFEIDSLGPLISFVNPTPSNGSAAESNYVYVNVSLSEAGKDVILEWTNSSGSYNFTMTNISSTSYWYNLTNLSDETYTYKVYAKDVYENENVSEERTVIVSTGAPVVFIDSPINNKEYNTTVQDLNVSASKTISKWVFQLNDENFTFLPNKTIASKFGNNTLTVWATDNYGNTGSAQVNYTITASEWLDTFGSYTGLSTSTNLKTGSNASTLFCWPALSSATTPQDNPATCWPHRRSINLSSSSSLTNYQVRLDLDLSTEYSAGKLDVDCNDLRFTYSNDTSASSVGKINYWIENCSDKSNIKVWVNVPTISSTTQVQVYYGNSLASSESNGTKVFNFFDEMDALSSDNWGSNIHTWEIENSRIYPTDSGSSAKITSSYTTPNSYVTELWFKGNSSSGASGYYGIGTGSYYLKLYLEPSNNRINLYNGANNYYTMNVSKEQKYTILSDFTNNNYKIYVNDSASAAISLTSAGSGGQTHPVFYPYVINGLTINRIAIRSYSTNDPTKSSLGSEEKPITNTTMKSELLEPQNGYWDVLKASTNKPTGTELTFKILDSSNNSLCGDLTSAQLTTGYEACSAVENNSIYLYAEFTTDSTGKSATVFNWSFNWTSVINKPDLYVESIRFLNDTQLQEGDMINVSINITNNGSVSADEFNLTINRSLYNGTKNLLNTTVVTNLNLSANSWKLINISWQVGTGTYVIDAYVDSENNIEESNETNNLGSNNITVSIWQIIYGDYTYNLTLESNVDKSYYDWSTVNKKGTLYYADTDSVYNYADLKGLSGTNDLQEADEALNVSGYQDGLSKLFDKDHDGNPDRTISAKIGGTTVTGIPIINTTNTSSFITGVLYDSADGLNYNGNQDLVFITFLNSSKQGKYGTYDFEIRIPSTLKSYIGSSNSVEQTLEVN